jgi:hypothetical protein
MRTLFQAVLAIISIASLPLILLNMLGGVVGGVWLLILGRFADFGFGLGVLCVGSLAISILLLPGMLFAGPGIAALHSGRFGVAVPLVALSTGWNYFAMFVWAALVIAFLLQHAEGHPIPYSLWAYANATGPWSYAASVELRQDRDAPAGTAVMFLQFGCVLALIGVWFFGVAPGVVPMAPLLGLPLVLGWLLQCGSALSGAQELARGVRADKVARDFT